LKNWHATQDEQQHHHKKQEQNANIRQLHTTKNTHPRLQTQ
jgi:hypothetical protein